MEVTKALTGKRRVGEDGCGSSTVPYLVVLTYAINMAHRGYIIYPSPRVAQYIPHTYRHGGRDGVGWPTRGATPTPISDDPPTPLHDNVFRRVFMGGAYSEYKRLIGFAYAFEQAMHVRLSRKVFVET